MSEGTTKVEVVSMPNLTLKKPEPDNEKSRLRRIIKESTNILSEQKFSEFLNSVMTQKKWQLNEKEIDKVREELKKIRDNLHELVDQDKINYGLFLSEINDKKIEFPFDSGEETPIKVLQPTKEMRKLTKFVNELGGPEGGKISIGGKCDELHKILSDIDKQLFQQIEEINDLDGTLKNLYESLKRVSFKGMDAYKQLKAAAEAFVMINCGTKFDAPESKKPSHRTYLSEKIPYMALIKSRLGMSSYSSEEAKYFKDIVEEKLQNPCLVELIWSYWHEESMLVQAMNSLCLKFQNKRSGYKNQFANLNLDPLRPLNNLMWGYIQDEPNRLSVQRRAYEYDYQYGLKLCGKAVPNMQSVESRSKFLEAFHNLLQLCTLFYKQEDDSMVNADGFPVLNALKDVQIILTQGMHNQYGDMPSTSRVEMLIQQWLLSRPEVREFLGGRTMVPYPENWMDHLDTIKTLQGWTDASSIHFHNLAVYGEQVLLSIRFEYWNDPNRNASEAADWAKFWRNEIQGYIHAYRMVTGVDLSANLMRPNAVDSTLPSVHLTRRLAAGAR